MKTQRQVLVSFQNDISIFAKYMELWIRFDLEPQYRKDYSKEFIAFMLLKEKGELDRYATALAGHRGDDVEALLQVKSELDRIFEERVVAKDGPEIRDILLRTLDCSSLVPVLNEYLALEKEEVSESSQREWGGQDLVDVGCELLRRRDEIQLLVDGLDRLVQTEAPSDTSRKVWPEIMRNVTAIDSVIKENALAFKPLTRIMKNYRRQFGKAALNRQGYWWWFLDEKIMERTVQEQIKQIINGLEAKFKNAVGEVLDGAQLQPAFALRGPAPDSVAMTQQVGENLCARVRLSRADVEKEITLSLFAYRMTAAGEEGVEGIGVTLRTEEGEMLASKTTPTSGNTELGQLAEGEFVIDIDDNKGTKATIALELRPA